MDQSLLQDASVDYRTEGSVATVTLGEPDRLNAQTPLTWRALAHVGVELPSDISVVILRAEGSSFSAGMDRRMFTPQGVPGEKSLGHILAAENEVGADIIAEFQAAFAWWRQSEAITIAAVQGHAIGAGFQLALACDLMVVADDVQLSMKESAYGLVPDLTGTHPLVTAVGYSRALEMCLTSRRIGAEEAVATGIAVRRAPRDDLDAVAGELAGHIAGLAPGTASATKHLLARALSNEPAEQQWHERMTQMDRLRHLSALFTTT